MWKWYFYISIPDISSLQGRNSRALAQFWKIIDKCLLRSKGIIPFPVNVACGNGTFTSVFQIFLPCREEIAGPWHNSGKSLINVCFVPRA
jgi:hypothetical protein